MNRKMINHYEEVYNAAGENPVLGITAEEAQAFREEIETTLDQRGYVIYWDRNARQYRVVPAKGFRAFIKRIVK